MTNKPTSKLQIRADVISVLNSLNSQNVVDTNLFEAAISNLKRIENKPLMLEILSKELVSSNTEKSIHIISSMLVELTPKDLLEAKMFNLLSTKEVSDRSKYYIIDILRQLGKNIDYERLVDYLNEPDEIIDIDTKKLLKTAVINPEAQIDFMDFLTALPNKEKGLLIDSLTDDYSGDNLCNILSPIIYSDPTSEISRLAIKAMAKTKSNLAIEVLNWIIQTQEEESVVKLANASLKELKIAGIYFNSAEQFKKKALENSSKYKCFSSLVDGHGNQAFVVTRIKGEDSLSLFAVVINDETGISDCFGFNELPLEDFSRLLGKFFSTDIKIEVPFEYVKSELNKAEALSYKLNNTLKYEYVCFRMLLSDVESRNFKIEIDKEDSKQSQKSLEELLFSNIFSKWFVETSDNKIFEELVNKINSLNTPNINDISDLLEKFSTEIFDEKFLQLIDSRLLNMAYLISLSRDEPEISCLIKTLIDDEKSKNKFLDTILKKSLYEHYLKQKFIAKEKPSANLFKKRNTENKNIEIDKVEKIISIIEKSWCNE